MPVVTPIGGISAMVNSEVGPEQMLRAAIYWLRGITGLFSMPLEFFLRRKFGSLYFSILTLLAAWVAIQTVGVVEWLGGMGSGKFSGLIGMKWLITVFDLGALFHIGRCVWMLCDLDREQDAESDGPGLAIFERLPKGDKWGWVRVVYEPGLCFLATCILYRFRILSGVAALYLVLCSVALAVKAALMLYEALIYLRKARDADSRGKLIKMIALGQALPQTVGGYALGAIPKNTPPQMVAVIVQKLTGLTPDLQGLVTPVEEKS